MLRLSAFLLVSTLALSVASVWGAGSVDAGRAAFYPRCVSCHSDPPTAPRFAPYRFNAAGLTSAFTLIGPMNFNLELGAQTIEDIAAFLGLPDGNDTDRLLDWGEDTFFEVLAPPRQPTQQFAGYSYRFYPASGVFVGTKDGSVWFFDGRAPGALLLRVGSMRSFLNQMPNGR